MAVVVSGLNVTKGRKWTKSRDEYVEIVISYLSEDNAGQHIIYDTKSNRKYHGRSATMSCIEQKGECVDYSSGMCKKYNDSKTQNRDQVARMDNIRTKDI